MRKIIIAGNWKMNKSPNEALAFIENLPEHIKNEKKVEMVVAGTFLCLEKLVEASQGTNIGISAQNMYWENNGAFTGEVSGKMLKDLGCKYVIIGHSERRQFFGENDISVNVKTKKALELDLVPIVCVGETLGERENNQTDAVVSSQVELALNGIKLNQGNSEKLVIAYEPVWAIGTGKTCDTKEAERVIAMIRGILAKSYGSEVANGVRILYGGSAKPENIKELVSAGNIDGGLVGGASLEPSSFAKLVENVK
ncbi:MAG: triose-phosphate isomerase [Candidatus Sericytochromatia bacterium]